MILGSHNSWTYLPIKQWWLYPFNFIAKCQEVDIRAQYEEYGVRCFDLRIRFNKKNEMEIAHGLVSYKISYSKLIEDLEYLNSKGDCYIRILHEVRNKFQKSNQSLFRQYCEKFESEFKNIKFFGGYELLNNKALYEFSNSPRCIERHTSVQRPIFDTTKMYAKWNNISNIALFNLSSENNDILLIDYVNIQN